MLSGFTWIIPERLAGSGRPGLLAPLAEDLRFIRERGFSLIVNLTERPLPGADDCGVRILHSPIADMGTPTFRGAASLCRQILDELHGGAVLVHCHAGLGRTGVILACCLVTLGEPPDGALTRIRTLRPLYVQTLAQERFIAHYADCLRKEN